MIKYETLEFDLGAGATAADPDRLEMTCPDSKELRAYFSVAGESRLLRVFFPNVDIFPLIDEMQRPLEEQGMEKVGTSPTTSLTRSREALSGQRNAKSEVVLPGSTHCLFVTGSDCLDVITKEEHRFCWVDSNTD